MPIVSYLVVLRRHYVEPRSFQSVTSVGGTSHIPEVAVSTFFSGGGFSNYVRLRYFRSLLRPLLM